jgi:hypothetical protein
MSPRGDEEVGGTDGIGAMSRGRAECVGRVDNEDGGALVAGAVGISVGASGAGIVAEIGAAGTLVAGAGGTTLLIEAGPGTDGPSAPADVTIGVAGPLAGPLVK